MRVVMSQKVERSRYSSRVRGSLKCVILKKKKKRMKELVCITAIFAFLLLSGETGVFRSLTGIHQKWRETLFKCAYTAEEYDQINWRMYLPLIKWNGEEWVSKYPCISLMEEVPALPKDTCPLWLPHFVKDYCSMEPIQKVCQECFQIYSQ